MLNPPATPIINSHHTLLQILEIKTESPDVINALSTLSGIYNDNTPAARRQLRCTIEQRGLQINGQFLQAAEAVMQVWLMLLLALFLVLACHSSRGRDAGGRSMRG
jgi:hypothetical protein